MEATNSPKKRRPHPASRARKGAAVLSVGAFAAITAGLAFDQVLESSAQSNQGDTTSTVSSGYEEDHEEEHEDEYEDEDDDENWGGATPATSSNSSGQSTTQSNGS